MFKKDTLQLTKITGTQKWVVAEDFPYMWDAVSGVVPKGFETDLASTPRVTWSVFPKSGIYTEAAVIHDHLYRCQSRWNRHVCDGIFKEALLRCGVGSIRAYLMYRAVRLGGSSSYKG